MRSEECATRGNITSEYVFFAGRRIARRDASGNIFFYDADHLGTTRTMTDSSGNICYDADLTPYGQEITVHTNSCPQNYKFTGYERDSETGLDYAMFRYYNSRLGRFMSPDPLGGDVGNPQSLNRYAYVLNNPLALVDPLGLCGNWFTDVISAQCSVSSSNPGMFGNGGNGSWEYGCVIIPGNDSHPPIRQCGLIWVPGRNRFDLQRLGPGAGPGSGPANNGRNCTPNPASAGQYAAATAQAVAMTAQFFSGIGSSNQTFGPGSSTSQVMAQSGPVHDVLNSYYMAGQTSGLYTFGGSGYVAAGGNPVAQFVGSFRWSITSGNGGINLSLTNTTSFRSLTYDMGPQWQRGSFPTPMGNTHQTYNIFVPCK